MKTRIFSVLILLLVVCSSSQAQFVDKNLSLPYFNWSIFLDLPDLILYNTTLSENSELRTWTFKSDNGYIMTVFFENTKSSRSSVESKNYFFGKTKRSGIIDLNTIRDFSVGEFECVDYFYKPDGEQTKTKSCNMYLTKDGIEIDIHFSKVNYTDSDSLEFSNIPNKISINSNFEDAVLDCFFYGSTYFLDIKYDLAKTYYIETLNAYKQNKRLDKRFWYMVVDNLGMIYVIANEVDKAISILEYGLEEDSSFPIFYYKIACCYAEKDNLEKAIEYLDLAKKYKANILEDWQLPNPEKDPSFQKYLENALFKKALENFKK